MRQPAPRVNAARRPRSARAAGGRALREQVDERARPHELGPSARGHEAHDHGARELEQERRGARAVAGAGPELAGADRADARVVGVVLDLGREVEGEPELVGAVRLAAPERVVEPQAAVGPARGRPVRVDRAPGARGVGAERVGRLVELGQGGVVAAGRAGPAGAGRGGAARAGSTPRSGRVRPLSLRAVGLARPSRSAQGAFPAGAASAGRAGSPPVGAVGAPAPTAAASRRRVRRGAAAASMSGNQPKNVRRSALRASSM